MNEELDICVCLEEMASDLLAAKKLIEDGEFKKADDLVIFVSPRLQRTSNVLWRMYNKGGSSE